MDFAQSQQSTDDDGDESALAAGVDEDHSYDIVHAFEDLLSKAETSSMTFDTSSRMLLMTSRSCNSIWRTICFQILEASAGKTEITTALESEKVDIAEVKGRPATLVTSQVGSNISRGLREVFAEKLKTGQMQRRCSSRRRTESRERRTHWCKKFWVLVDRQRQISEVSCWGWRKSLCLGQLFGPSFFRTCQNER